MEFLMNLWKEEEGQGLAEYGLILALVALAVITVLGLLGDELVTIFGNVVDGLKGTDGD